MISIFLYEKKGKKTLFDCFKIFVLYCTCRKQDAQQHITSWERLEGIYGCQINIHAHCWV